MLFIGTGGVIQQNNSRFFWDNTTFFLGTPGASAATAAFTVATGNSSAAGSGTLNLKSGTSVSSGSGAVNVFSGNATSANSGAVSFTSGNCTTSGASGAFSMLTGNSVGTSGAIDAITGSSTSGASGTVRFLTNGTTATGSGLVTIKSGSGSGSGGSGTIELASGDSSSTGSSGTVYIYSGAAANSGVGNNSGDISILTGYSNKGMSGAFTFQTGTTAATGTPSGYISLGTGAANGDSASGSLTIFTGFSNLATSGPIAITSGYGNDQSGSVSLTTGGGDSTGPIYLNTGSAGSQASGDINIETGNSNLAASGTLNLGTGPSPSAATYGPIVFKTNSTERARFHGNGDFAFGTTADTANFLLQGPVTGFSNTVFMINDQLGNAFFHVLDGNPGGYIGYFPYAPVDASSWNAMYIYPGQSYSGAGSVSATAVQFSPSQYIDISGGGSSFEAILVSPNFAINDGTANNNYVALNVAPNLSLSGGSTLTRQVALQVAITSASASTNYAATFSGGNVGIGTTDPGMTLHIVGNYGVGPNAPDVAGTYSINNVVLGNNDKTVAANENIVLFGSNDAGAANPLSCVIRTLGGATTADRQIHIQSTEAGVGQVSLLLNPDGGYVSVGMNPAKSTLEVVGSFGARVAADSGTTLSLDDTYTTYSFTGGSATTWTLPDLATSIGRIYFLKNRGSANITLQRAGADNIYDTSSVTSITIGAGQARTIINDGSYWVVA